MITLCLSQRFHAVKQWSVRHWTRASPILSNWRNYSMAWSLCSEFLCVVWFNSCTKVARLMIIWVLYQKTFFKIPIRRQITNIVSYHMYNFFFLGKKLTLDYVFKWKKLIQKSNAVKGLSALQRWEWLTFL